MDNFFHNQNNSCHKLILITSFSSFVDKNKIAQNGLFKAKTGLNLLDLDKHSSSFSHTSSYLKSYVDFLNDCCLAGVTAIQIREKNMSWQGVLVFFQLLRDKIADKSFPIFINDSIDLAKKAKTNHLHLGQSDGDIVFARESLGKDSIIGLSIETNQELAFACDNMLANYLAASSVFASKNKTNQKNIWGLEGLEFFCRNSKIPVVAIGGIEISNLYDVMKAGVDGIAVISAIHDAVNPKSTIKHIIGIINNHAKTS